MSTAFSNQNVSKVHGYCSASVLNNHASESLKSLHVTAMIQSKNDADVVKIILFTKQVSPYTVYLGQRWMHNMNHIIYFVN